jgi:hypothetical protein
MIGASSNAVLFQVLLSHTISLNLEIVWKFLFPHQRDFPCAHTRPGQLPRINSRILGTPDHTKNTLDLKGEAKCQHQQRS